VFEQQNNNKNEKLLFLFQMMGARRFDIKKEQELRVSPKSPESKVFVTLSARDNGTAEIFGTELAPRRKYAIVKVNKKRLLSCFFLLFSVCCDLLLVWL
jgi:hypothetical protein